MLTWQRPRHWLVVFLDGPVLPGDETVDKNLYWCISNIINANRGIVDIEDPDIYNNLNPYNAIINSEISFFVFQLQ